jgi:hypothetical protein
MEKSNIMSVVALGNRVTETQNRLQVFLRINESLKMELQQTEPGYC